MRIPSGVTDQYIYFVAVDSTDLKTRETGLSSFTVYRSRNGGVATAMTTPTVNETDSTNMPGVYELLVDEDTTIDSGDDSQEMVFHITATGMAPVTRTIEIYRPKVTAGETIGVSSGAVTNVGTVATNSDKTGYSISGTKTTLDALNDIAATDIVSGGAITTSSGAVSNVTTVATTTTNTDMRGTDGAYTGTPPTATAIADAVLDEVLSGHTTAGTLGKAVADIEADTNELQSDNVPGLIAALNDISTAQVNAEVDTALADYDGPTKAELDAGLAALNDLSTTDILGMAYESTEDFQDFLRLTRAVLLGKTTGAGTGTENFRDRADGKNRVVSTIDSNGDRTAITTDAT